MIGLTMDANDPSRLAAFWRLALGYVDEPPPAPFATREDWLRSYGIDPDEDDEDAAWLQDPTGVGPRLAILQVPEPKTAKNRLHIDHFVPGGWDGVRSEVARLVTAGGSVVAEFDGHHVVMADPEGNEFCVAQQKSKV